MGIFTQRRRARISSNEKLTFEIQMARVYHMNDEVLEVRSTILAKYESAGHRNSSTSWPN
jgi:hypothetical protein